MWDRPCRRFDQKFRARTDVGIDISPPMLGKAKAKGIYSALHQGDLIAFLHDHPAGCDVITSAATLIHFGDLCPVFEAAAESLRCGGLLIFTVFPNAVDEDGFAVETLDGFAQGGCFQHGRNYVVRAAEASGFSSEVIEIAIHEFHKGKPKVGLVVALRRRDRSVAM